MARWAVQDAKARFSELVRVAVKEPQWISHRGQDTAVVVSVEDFNRLLGSGKAKRETKNLSDALRNCPRVRDFELPPRGFERMRRIDFG